MAFKLGMMFSTNADKISPKVSKLSRDFGSLGRNVKQGDKDFSKYFSRLRKNNNTFSNITKDANRANASISKLTRNVSGMFNIFNAGTLSSFALGKVIGDSVQSAVDMIETTNLFSVAMGNLAVETNTAVVELHKFTGLDTTNVQSTIGTYNLLARSMGISAENSQILSTNTQKLALDLSSLTNVPLNQVMQDLRSGLVGQSETVYKYGLDITEATLKQEAMIQGITKSVRNMSQGEKVALRYSAMIRQSALAHGDFARTIDTPANQMKIFTERTATLSRAFGSLFIPTLERILPYLNAFLQVLTQIIQTIATMIGYVPPVVENMNNSFGGIEDGADDAVDAIGGIGKALKELNSRLGIDELNVINKNDSSVGGVSGFDDSAFDLQLKGYDNLMNQVKQKSDTIAESMRQSLNKMREALEPILNANTQPLVDSLSRLWNAVTPFSGYIGNGLKFFYENIIVPFTVWMIESGLPFMINNLARTFEFLGSAIEFLSPYFYDLFYNILKPFGTWVLENNELIGYMIVGMLTPLTVSGIMFGALLGVQTLIDKMKGLFMLMSANPIMLLVSVIGALAGAFVYAYQHNDEFKNRVDNLWFSIKEHLIGAFNKLKDIVTIVWQNVFVPLGNFFIWLWKEVIKPLGEIMINGLGKSFEFCAYIVKSFYENVIKPLAHFLYTVFVETIKAVIEILSYWWSNVLQPIGSFILNVFTPVIQGVIDVFTFLWKNVMTPLIDWMGGYFKNKFDTIMSNIKVIIEGLEDVFVGIITFIKGVFTNDWSTAWNGIKQIFEGIVKMITGIWDNLIDSIKEKIDWLMDKLKFWEDNEPKVSTGGGGSSGGKGASASFGGTSTIDLAKQRNADLSNPKIKAEVNDISKSTGYDLGTAYTIWKQNQPKLARGGSLSMGQFFQAGELGKAELIGSYNNRTTVMPLENSGFVEAMYQAVYNAVLSAQDNNGGQVIENVLNLDGEIIYRNQQKIGARRGVNFGMGVFAR